MIIDLEKYNITPQKDITYEFNHLLEDLKKVKGKKVINLKKGTYYFNTDKMPWDKHYISNTIAEKEWYENDKLNHFRFAVRIENINDLEINGNGALFLIDGISSSIIINNSKNIKIDNLKIDYQNPHLHKLDVISSENNTTKFKLKNKENVFIKDNTLYFKVKDFTYNIKTDTHYAWWHGLIKDNNKPIMQRSFSPFVDYKTFEIKDDILTVKYNKEKKHILGSTYYIFDVRRRNVGIFVKRSNNIFLNKISHYFSYSLATIFQDTKNIRIENSRFSPKDKNIDFSSVADFIQLVMCRGKIKVKNNIFKGAGDDILNVHGFHFKVIEKDNKNITISFMHPQSFGFNPFYKNDKIVFIKAQTLEEISKRKVISSKMIDNYKIRLELDKEIPYDLDDLFIENLSANPSLDYVNNKSSHIMTRGLLITTRGKVRVLNNNFIANNMSGILLSNDAKTWFESGRTCNLIIKGNTFNNQGEAPIFITPEVLDKNLIIHGVVKIINNRFLNYKSPAIIVKNTKKVVIRDNHFENKENDYQIIK